MLACLYPTIHSAQPCINADLSSFRVNLSFYLTLEITQIIVIELSSKALIFNIYLVLKPWKIVSLFPTGVRYFE